MNLHKKELKQKEFIKLSKEISKLYGQRWNAESIPLDKPIRHGWKRSFRLRDDASRRDDVKLLKIILKRINNVEKSRRKDFKKRVGKTWVEHSLPLQSIAMDKWDLPPECLKYFYLCDSHCQECWYKGKKMHRPRYHFRYPFYLEVKVEPNYLTHYKVPDPILESRIKKINDKMYNEGGWATLDRLHGRRHHWEYGYDKSIPGLRQADTDRQMMDDLKDK